uniref:Uncharacterized protein n=1 Tax=Arundo donax TaxID=35708 RepID=A0A0A9FM17_ARUDO
MALIFSMPMGSIWTPYPQLSNQVLAMNSTITDRYTRSIQECMYRDLRIKRPL